ELRRDGLRIPARDRLSRSQSQVELTRQVDRTGLGALAAPGAPGRVHIGTASPQFRAKMSRVAFNVNQICVGEDLDIEVTPNADQPRRQNAHGAVIRGEGLVQLRHYPTNAGLFFGKVNFVARVS